MASGFQVNVYRVYALPLRSRISKAMKFKVPGVLDLNELIDAHLLQIHNKVQDVPVWRAGNWSTTPQAFYIAKCKRDKAKGVYFGLVEVGSRGAILRIRKNDGNAVPIGTGDFGCRDFFFRLELPPDSALGFLIVERQGRHSAASALQQALRRKVNNLDHVLRFDQVTDEDEIEKWLTGSVQSVKAHFEKHVGDARKTIQKTSFMGDEMGSKDDLDIEIRVRRKLTQQMKKSVRDWLTKPKADRPQIVTFPVSDDPDKIVLNVLAADGSSKALHPEMIADMMLTVDLSDKVSRNTAGAVDVDSANAEAATICANLRPELV